MEKIERIVTLQFGSHLYGTQTPESDVDWKSIYLPTGRDIVLHSYKPTINETRSKAEGERNTRTDVDLEVVSLDQFMRLLMQGQTMALDMLFGLTSSVKHSTAELSGTGKQIMDAIYANRERLITKDVAAFVGYARQQASKYGIKGSRMDALQRTMAVLEPLPVYDRLEKHARALIDLVKECEGFVSLEKSPLVEILSLPDVRKDPSITFPYLQVCGRKMAFTATVKVAKECFGKILAEYGGRAKKANLDGGVDWKALSHAVRVNSEAVELLTENTIIFPRPDRRLLLAIKLGQLPYEQVAEMIEKGLADLIAAQATSTLRSTPDREWADDFIYDIYSRRVR